MTPLEASKPHMRLRDRVRTYQEPCGVCSALLLLLLLVGDLASPTLGGESVAWRFYLTSIAIALLLAGSGRLWMKKTLEAVPKREHYFVFLAVVVSALGGTAGLVAIAAGNSALQGGGSVSQLLEAVSAVLACLTVLTLLFAFAWSYFFAPNREIAARVDREPHLPNDSYGSVHSMRGLLQESASAGKQVFGAMRYYYFGEHSNSSDKQTADRQTADKQTGKNRSSAGRAEQSGPEVPQK